MHFIYKSNAGKLEIIVYCFAIEVIIAQYRQSSKGDQIYR